MQSRLAPRHFPRRQFLALRSRARIGALEPDRATRLGGPIRHVTAALARIHAQTRMYGVEDVRRAVHESGAAGICQHPVEEGGVRTPVPDQ